MTDRWLEVSDGALTRHDARMASLENQIEIAESQMENTARNLERIRREMKIEVQKFNKEQREIQSWKDNPTVYIRNYQETTIAVYHASLQCGRGGNPRRMRPVLLGEALKMGKRPCTSCGYLASALEAA
jgi:hypothetical protein